MIKRDVLIDATYPDTFPCPSAGDYAASYVPDAERTKMQSGWVRNRQLAPYIFRALQLHFTMPVDKFSHWHYFIHSHMNKWIEMKVQLDTGFELRPVRFSSGPSYQYGDWNLVEASIQAEVMMMPPPDGVVL